MIDSTRQLFFSDILIFLIVFVIAMMMALKLTSWLIGYFRQKQIVAHSNKRSMHKDPVPVGGGWAIISLTLIAWIVVSWLNPGDVNWITPIGAFLLALLSWVDDRRTVQAVMRFAMQIGVIAVVLLMVPEERTVFSDSWPLWSDRMATGLCWLWFVNLFNFMDGIDGLAGVEIISICAGLALIGLVIGTSMPVLYVLIVLAGATAGFLWWNWHPASIFLGDVGSVPIGFLLGWFLIELAMEGYVVAAFLLPAYFITDASLTLLKRLFRGEPFWRPHKSHFYQRAATGLRNHAKAVWHIIPANIGLICAALASICRPVIAVICGVVLLVILLFVLERQAKK